MELLMRNTDTADSLAEALFSLAEPWRSRFLAFLAERATRWAWDGGTPSRQQVAVWLGDSSLYEVMALMLCRWAGAETQTGTSLRIH
jgi:hypothetical protein